MSKPSKHSARPATIICLVVLFLACGRSAAPAKAKMSTVRLTDKQARHIAAQKIFFGHQSVGDNIVQGIRELLPSYPNLYLNIVSSSDPGKVAGPAFVESHVGENTNPKSKNEAFLRAIVEKGLGPQNAIVMLKYCYVDIRSGTDVPSMFKEYSTLISQLKTKYPILKIIHITVPLTTVETQGKAWLKAVLGKPTEREDNIKRNQFNQLLKEAYPSDTVFDLAEVESTHTDGSRSYFMDSHAKVYSLAPEYTSDGGHLNEAGRRAAAQRLLAALANL